MTTMEQNSDSASDSFKCYMDTCGEIFQKSLDATKHIKSTHGVLDKSVSIPCMKIQKEGLICKTKCTSFSAIRAHMNKNKCILFSRPEPEVDQNVIDVGSAHHTSFVEDSLLNEFAEFNIDDDDEMDENVASSIHDFIGNYVDKLIKANLTHDTLDDILKYSKELVHKTIEIATHAVGRSTRSMKDIEDALRSAEKNLTFHLNQLSTRYRRRVNYVNHEYYVTPRSIPVGENYFQYVPILESLKSLFADKNFKDMYFAYNNNHQCKEGVYERYCCGQNYKKNYLFQLNKNCIQIQLFYDDVQLTCALKTRPHKVCAIYFIVRNLPLNFTSKLDNMYLVCLSDSKLVAENGYNAILKPIVDDIKILETDGIHTKKD